MTPEAYQAAIVMAYTDYYSLDEVDVSFDYDFYVRGVMLPVWTRVETPKKEPERFRVIVSTSNDSDSDVLADTASGSTIEECWEELKKALSDFID